jgi:hypothetical protein
MDSFSSVVSLLFYHFYCYGMSVMLLRHCHLDSPRIQHVAIIECRKLRMNE